MSLDKAVEPYVDQVKDGNHNQSSVGDNFDPDKDEIFHTAVDAVAEDAGVQGLLKREGPTGVTEGCRATAMDLLAVDTRVDVDDVITAMREELRMWAEVPVTTLDWKADHFLDLRRLGANETEIVLTVRKRGGTQQVCQVVPFSVAVVEHSWNEQQSNWKPVEGTENQSDEEFREDRDLVFVDSGNAGQELGRLRWKLIHINPNGDTTSDDSFEYLEAE